MNTLFIRLLNLSIAATWIILAVILIRAFSKKAPKWFPCILWALVGIRLLCPVTIPSPLSLVPREEVIPINISSFWKIRRIMAKHFGSIFFISLIP